MPYCLLWIFICIEYFFFVFLRNYTCTHCLNFSDFTIFPQTNGMAPSSLSDSEILHDNLSLLHRFVSEGNLSGVRSVHFPMLIS